MNTWVKFPHDDSAYQYTPVHLAELWQALHCGDKAPWPDEHWVTQHGNEEGSAADTAQALQAAWQAFHRGDFGAAVEQADAIGILGHTIANKATGIYADYLEEDEQRQQQLYESIIRRAEQAIAARPQDPNSHYFHAYAVGRYSQSISITKALSQGLGGKVRKSLENTLKLDADHAEAHLAMGLFHAEIINKVGKLVGGMTYGASADEAISHFERALELAPELPVIQIEYGNGLYLLYGDKRMADMTAAYEKAAAIQPLDAMQYLDRDYALSELQA